MPPGQELAASDIDTLRRWIDAGALFEESGAASASDVKRKAEMAKLEERPITPEERQFWAFRAPERVDPAVKSPNPIDGFLAVMRQKQLKPSPRADRRTLIRRAYLDLLGLPPEPSEVEAFVNDTNPKAWERLIDKLLESPHYGERWGRHWLDLVRFADSGGFERDYDWLNAWRYRDYVIQAFNDDKPYDRFIREQLAGDELDSPTTESMIATGYLRLGMDNNIKDERTRMDELDDLVATTSLSFLGMTVGCARCHNHKFDPIPQKDYYRLQAVFFSTQGHEYPLVSAEEQAAHQAEMSRIDRSAGAPEDGQTFARGAIPEASVRGEPQGASRVHAGGMADAAGSAHRGTEAECQPDREDAGFKDEQIREKLSSEDAAKQIDLIAEIKKLDDQRPKPFPLRALSKRAPVTRCHPTFCTAEARTPAAA